MKTHVGVDAVCRLRGDWEKLQYHPNSDLDHCLLVCRFRPEVLDPWALSVWEGDRCRAIVVGRLERSRLRPRIGYARLPGIQSKILVIVHEGILGDVDNETSQVIAGALFHVLQKRQADVVSLHALPESVSGIWTALQTKLSQTLGVVSPDWKTHRGLILPKEPGFLLKNMRSKHRSWVKRKERDLSEAYPSRIQWSWHKENLDLTELRRRMETVASATYQRGLNAGFVDNEEMRDRLALFAGRGQTRVSLLEIDGVPKAFWLGTVYRGVFYSGATGYTPDMRQFEVGTAMFLRLTDELVREGVERLDFGLGDADYKERFGDQSRREADVHLFGPVPKSRFLRVYLGGADMLDKTARRLVRNLGVFSRIKQVWRTRLRKRQSAPPASTD